ncbi:hypothetical protein [Brucella pituitosa]|uniref:hypothetical protein n=1 Tax=Brucella pituitosa TaxID=571256 RepID=UPI0009A24E24|nr:hypothetical protein [Brucella pituitosa]
MDVDPRLSYYAVTRRRIEPNQYPGPGLPTGGFGRKAGLDHFSRNQRVVAMTFAERNQVVAVDWSHERRLLSVEPLAVIEGCSLALFCMMRQSDGYVFLSEML